MTAEDQQTLADMYKIQETIEQRMYELGENHPNYDNLKDILDVVAKNITQLE